MYSFHHFSSVQGILKSDRFKLYLFIMLVLSMKGQGRDAEKAKANPDLRRWADVPHRFAQDDNNKSTA